jgi:hypothetical protein
MGTFRMVKVCFFSNTSGLCECPIQPACALASFLFQHRCHVHLVWLTLLFRASDSLTVFACHPGLFGQLCLYLLFPVSLPPQRHRGPPVLRQKQILRQKQVYFQCIVSVLFMFRHITPFLAMPTLRVFVAHVSVAPFEPCKVLDLGLEITLTLDMVSVRSCCALGP